jgi:tRNA threonylcarbamoyladenosine biosynthesis protein TsaB
MIVLGIETSTQVCSIGLVDGQGGRWETSIVDRHIHSEKLVTLLERTMAAAALERTSLGAIAISIGPGSFTGLRIGLSAAKGLCKALGAPIVAVSTFEAVATGVFDEKTGAERVMVAVDAKGDDFYITVFERVGDSCRALSKTAIVPLNSARSVLAETRLVCTDRIDRVRDCFGPKTEVLDIHRYCSGARVAAWGRGLALQGRWSNVATLEPFYMKDFVVRQSPGG